MISIDKELEEELFRQRNDGNQASELGITV